MITEEKKEPSIFATMTAATAWCKPETEKIQMDPILATAFAEVIEEVVAKVRVGERGPTLPKEIAVSPPPETHSPAPEEPIA